MQKDKVRQEFSDKDFFMLVQVRGKGVPQNEQYSVENLLQRVIDFLGIDVDVKNFLNGSLGRLMKTKIAQMFGKNFQWGDKAEWCADHVTRPQACR